MDSLIDFLLSFYGPTHYILIFAILMACGLGLPMPEDITLFAAGVLCYFGITDLWGMIAVSMFGVLLGDSIIFFLGAKYGRKLTKKKIFSKILHEERLEELKRRMNKRGNALIFAGRFMPGLRAPIFFTAGTLHVPFRVFLAYDGTAALISVPLIIGVVYTFGDYLESVVHTVQRVEHGILFVILTVIAVFSIKWYVGRRKSSQTDGTKG